MKKAKVTLLRTNQMTLRTQIDSALNHLETLLAIGTPSETDIESITVTYEEIDYLLACLVSRQTED